MTAVEKRLVRECLVAAIEGPFFSDAVFHPLFGFGRERFAELLSQHDAGETLVADAEARGDLRLLMRLLLDYPHQQESAWGDFITASREHVRATVRRLEDGG